jgi:nicotinate-nucleotide pyrophosphorylase (carboxylating)
MDNLNGRRIDRLVKVALEEDLGKGDITTDLLIPSDILGQAAALVKEEGVSAGVEVAARVFRMVDASLKISIEIPDGSRVKPGDILMRVSGKVGSILKAERVALNFLQRLSGIASSTAQYVAAVEGLKVGIADTRKTTPGLRALEKYAVKKGGGRNHRFDLHEAVLIKDNHFAALRSSGLSYAEIVAKAAKGARPGVKVEAEATTLEEAVEAVEAGAQIVMLDNMALEEMRDAVKAIDHRAEVEASGGVSLKTVRAIAETGVDFISVGALTHSYKALDISLEYESDFSRETG